MIAIHVDKVRSIQFNFFNEIEEQREIAITKLKKLNKKTTNLKDKTYLEEVILLFDSNPDILLWDSIKINNEKDKFSSLPTYPKTSKTGKVTLCKTEIKDKILTALGYRNLRSSFYPMYFKEIGIKSCVYCNSQLTISAKKSSVTNDYSAKFDVDHYHSKSEYPFLSICLFNLYPACSSCNRIKSDNVVEFELYTNNRIKAIKSDYKFKLTAYSKAKYLITKDPKDIGFTFYEPTPSNITAKTINDVFHIEGIYQTQTDLIEELIIKSQIYNKSYLKTLKYNFDKLSIQPELFKRTLVGNYTGDKDLHKRPMSKLVSDIAKDLGLI
ncbi:hypothetical protein [Formosa sp. PL04]|uniref:hypothetical protein n=1 Tax=Formosa sp. PL04 TaxID=3081755 RepID=UPI0029824246|nr:hypothetical protein [Formosa sp. PL04]MDW5288876.1 hypothetical protein [Formosa sp. PL04]